MPWLTASPALRQLPGVQALLGAPVRYAGPAQGVLAWGCKPSATRAGWLARWRGLPLVRLEDGFLRSFATGDRGPALSLVVDEQGIYYDSTRPSALEARLQSAANLLAGREAEVARAQALLLQHRLSKYNHAPGLQPGTLLAGDRRRVLVVDQTKGDVSVRLGAANAATFGAMLAAARAENPDATIYIKTHPEATAGRKGGYLTGEQPGVSAAGQRTVLLRGLVNPLELVQQMDRVYVVTSTLGFEALLAGKPVTCFGLPWYAGWGATDDRQRCPRRTRQRSVLELFAAAYFDYARYLNPHTHERGDIFDVIAWLQRQRVVAGLAAPASRAGAFSHDTNDNAAEGADSQAAPPAARRLMAVGLPAWRRHNLGPLLAARAQRLHCVADAKQAKALAPEPGDVLLCWGRDAPPGLQALASRSGAALWRMEDGFYRSVGLGSDLIPPGSVVMDSRGLYFDPGQASDLEHVLANACFSPAELAQAQAVRAFVVEHRLTKYNLEPHEEARWPAQGRPVVLVPGQVEDDASVRCGGGAVVTNLGLLQAARQACPGAFIVYKPHPDVASRNRRGRVAQQDALRWADHVETRLSVVSCIEASDEVHTITSQAGFEALLRGKRVVTYGQPFYAGWGLTLDRAANGPVLQRRQRRLSLDELVAGTLLRYPLYWDWTLRGWTECAAALHHLQARREALNHRGGLERLRQGWWRRQMRKLGTVLRALGT